MSKPPSSEIIYVRQKPNEVIPGLPAECTRAEAERRGRGEDLEAAIARGLYKPKAAPAPTPPTASKSVSAETQED